MNQPSQPNQPIPINININDKEPFKCDGTLEDGQTCGHQFFVQYFQLFYVSKLEGAPQPLTVPRPVWVCARCRKGYLEAKPNEKKPEEGLKPA